MADNFDDIFKTASSMMKSRQDQTPDPEPEAEVDWYDVAGDGPDDSPGDGPSEEELLHQQKAASAEWRAGRADKSITLSEEAYVTNQLHWTPEEFQVRKAINEDLQLEVSEVMNYNTVPEDVLYAVACLAPDEQKDLAREIRNRKIKPEVLTTAQVQGFRKGVSLWDQSPDQPAGPESSQVKESSPEPEDAENSGSDSEPILEVENNPDPGPDLEPEPDETVKAPDSRADKIRIVEEMAREFDKEHPDESPSETDGSGPQAESSPEADASRADGPQTKPETDPAPAGSSVKDDEKPVIHSAVEEMIHSGDSKGAEELVPNKPDLTKAREQAKQDQVTAAGEDNERGIMTRESLDPLVDILQTYLNQLKTMTELFAPLQKSLDDIAETAGSAVTEQDYNNMMKDSTTLQEGFTNLLNQISPADPQRLSEAVQNLLNYYLGNALYSTEDRAVAVDAEQPGEEAGGSPAADSPQTQPTESNPSGSAEPQS